MLEPVPSAGAEHASDNDGLARGGAASGRSLALGSTALACSRCSSRSILAATAARRDKPLIGGSRYTGTLVK